MKTIFDKATREELIARISLLNEINNAQWGSMSVFQMIKHCSLWEEMMLGRKKYKRAFAGYLFGRIALKAVTKDDGPLRKNSPTIPEFKIKESDGDIEIEKNKWIKLIEEYADFSNDALVHPFFGSMTKEQIGYMVYKHTDHHLRQFNG
ncbi:MAG: DUF1569 domain-containing protein [Bacteroidota bacterium]